MMGGEINFGSRTEFLPGERLEESDIKYQRYGGCFVSYTKGFFYIVLSLLFAAVVGFLVYNYGLCHKTESNDYHSADAFISDLLSSEANSKHDENSHLSENIIPSYYRIKIKPYLDEDSKQFTFDGEVSIVFQVTGAPNSLIVINSKNLTISESDVSVTFSTKPKVEPLRSESQIKENQTTTVVNIETTTNPPVPVTNNTIPNEKSTHLENTTEIPTNTTIILNNTTETSLKPTTTPVTTTQSSTPSSISTTPNPAKSSTSPAETTTSKPIVLSTDSESVQEYIQIIQHKYSEEDETYKLRLKYELTKGINYTLTIKYTGKITTGPGGVLRSSYRQGRETKWIVSTYFKHSYARTAFPCFDDPKFKSKYEISVARKTNMRTVSNMRLNETHPVIGSSGWVWDHFEISHPMPTYLVSFAVFEFTASRAAAMPGLPLMEIWTRPQTANRTKYALSILPKILESYNKFLKYHYSLPKLDLVAIPNYPYESVGTWGLIIFREDIIAIGENALHLQKEETNKILSQELARQWFCNLINIRSWKDTWLLESISKYISYIGVNNAEKSWETDVFPYTDLQDVLHIDSMNILPKLSQIHCVHNDLRNILNKKGSTIIKVLNDTLGESQFKLGLQNFIVKWKYESIEPDNFWTELSAVSNKTIPSGTTVNDIVNLWINQEGYPMVHIETNMNNKSASVIQHRYTDKQLTSSNVWILPLYYTTGMSLNNKIWLMDKALHTIDNVIQTENNTWLILNSHQTSLCRTNYDLNNWNSLITLLRNKTDTMSPVNRAQLLDDAFHLAKSGHLNNHVYFNLTLYLKDNEQHFIPWSTALKIFQYFDTILSKDSHYGQFQEYVLNLIEPIYNKLGFESRLTDSHSTIKLRSEIIHWACKLNHKSCIDWAYSQFSAWSNNSDSIKINNDLSPVIYCTGVKMLRRSAWELLWDKFSKSKDTFFENNEALITGLGCVEDNWLIRKYLNETLNEESLHNSVLMWKSISSKSAFAFLQENWPVIYKKYSHSQLITIMKNILSQLSTNDELMELIKFMSERKSDIQCFSKDIISMVETVKQKVTWKEEFVSSFNEWSGENI